MSQATKVCTISELCEMSGYRLNTSLRVIEGRMYDAGTVWYRERDGHHMTLGDARVYWLESVGEEHMEDLLHYTDRLGGVVER